MSRLKPIETTCSYCSKKFLAKRSDAKFCGSGCRAQWSNVQKAKPAIIAEATPEIIEAARPAIIAEVVAEVKKMISKQYQVNVTKNTAGVTVGMDRGRELFLEELEFRFQKLVVDGTHFYDGPEKRI